MTKAEIEAAREVVAKHMGPYLSIGRVRSALETLCEAALQSTERGIIPVNPDWEAEMRALKPGWDNYGGQPITEAAIQTVQRLQATPPRIVPISLGGLMIIWPGFYLFIEPNGE